MQHSVWFNIYEHAWNVPQSLPISQRREHFTRADADAVAELVRLTWHGKIKRLYRIKVTLKPPATARSIYEQ